MLNFKVGDIILLECSPASESSNVWRGCLNGRWGVFPRACVSELNDDLATVCMHHHHNHNQTVEFLNGFYFLAPDSRVRTIPCSCRALTISSALVHEPVISTPIARTEEMDSAVQEVLDDDDDDDMMIDEGEMPPAYIPPSKPSLTFEQLTAKPPPAEVIPSRLEAYLSDGDFVNILGMDRREFYSLKAWRRTEVKRKAKLF